MRGRKPTLNFNTYAEFKEYNSERALEYYYKKKAEKNRQPKEVKEEPKEINWKDKVANLKVSQLQF